MKKTRIGALLTALIIFALFSCDDQLLTSPNVPVGGDGVPGGRSAVPDGIRASHGEKQSITLTWNANSNATLYYIYKADSPLNSFSRAAETTNTQYKFNVSPGTTAYYRVSSVSRDGKESSQSMYVKGTSLAQPIISDITDKNESEVTVTWYMDNVSDDTYKSSLLYTVYCFIKKGGAEVAQIALDGSALDENKATFNNLSANAEYEFQVEAYLRSDQSASEKSMKVDAATARRMRPGAPVNLRASRGTSAEKIELHFELPDEVDIALGDNQFEQKPIYFVISKRRYNANAYEPYCLYFGSNAETATAKGGETFDDYTPGATVKWTDSAVSRGVEYEYQVQSYVDDTTKNITADSSKASATGWALSRGTLSLGKVDYQLNAEGELYASAELPLVFSLDHKDVEYDYHLVETIEPLNDNNNNDPTGTVTRPSDALTYNQIKNHVAQMDLTQKTTAHTPGRGSYSYAVKINLKNGGTIDTVSNIGKIDISEQTEKIIVEGFSVQDGYKDKFVFKWQYYNNRKYILHESANGSTGWTPIATINPTPDNDSTESDLNYSYTYMAGVTTGQTRYFAIRPYRVVGGTDHSGQMVYADDASQTLGVPVLSLGGDASYGTITATWSETQKADAYRIRYWYTEGAEAGIKETKAIVKASDLSQDLSNRLVYRFSPFENNIDADKAGLEIQVEVDALNEGLRTKIGGGEIATTSTETVKKRLVGPALLSPSASEAALPRQINVSWNKITGANGYYVFRRQFNMNNTAEEGTEAIVYYVPASESPSISGIIGKNLTLDSSNIRVDTTTVEATASFAAPHYTLKDIYMSDDKYNNSINTQSYRNQQNDMAQGFSYRYYIVPVVNSGDFTSIEFVYAKDGSNKNTNISYYTINENGKDIRYNDAYTFEKTGFTIGFGQNVTASKGTYTSNPSSNYPTNNGIQVTWSAPPRLAQAGITHAYDVYRKAYNAGIWDKITTVNVPNYIDSSTSLTKGITYEYLIGISTNGGSPSEPGDSARFIASCREAKDEKGRSNMLGYMLGLVRMDSVSRNEQTVNGNFAEEIKWFSDGIKYSTSNNDPRWGIDGYTVFVMNRNIDANWHRIADIPYANILNQTNQSIKVTNVQGGDTLEGGLLKVLRDYKHYYKIHSYVLNGSEKVYGPDPDWNFETLFAANRTNQDNTTFLQTDYVKWGARQITPTEFAKIATLAMTWGIHGAAGARGSWSGKLSGANWQNAGNNGSGRSGAQHNGSTRWWFYYDNYKPSFDTRANKGGSGTLQTTVVSINTSTNTSDARIIVAYTVVSGQYPRRYLRDGNYGSAYINITGPSCVSPLYTGRLRFGNSSSTELNWSGGFMDVIYPDTASAVQITGGQANTPLPFHDQSMNYRQDGDEWY
jgi:hypothetical protein